MCSRLRSSCLSVFSLTVIRFSLVVITDETGLSKWVSNRKSRLVTMPTRSSPSTTGIPENLLERVSSITSPMVAVGLTVTGSRTTPLSKRFTLRTSSACSVIVIFLWRMPSPPSCATAIAKRLSVTVSIAAESNGILIEISRVSLVVRLTSRGNTFE